MEKSKRLPKRSITLKSEDCPKNCNTLLNDRLARYKTKLNFYSVVKPPAIVPLYTPAPKVSKLLLDYLNSTTPPKKTAGLKQLLNSSRDRPLPSLLKHKVHHKANVLTCLNSLIY